MKPQEFEDRLIDFAVAVLGVVETLPGTKVGKHIAGQLVRSGTSPAPNYGEAGSAESRKDFIHKMKISFNQLRETDIIICMVNNHWELYLKISIHEIEGDGKFAASE